MFLFILACDHKDIYVYLYRNNNYIDNDDSNNNDDDNDGW